MKIKSTWLVLIFAALAIGSSVLALPDLLRLKTSPSVKFVSKSVSTRSQFVEDQKYSTDSTFRTYDCSLEKTGTGWKLTSTLTHCAMKRDSTHSDSLFQKVMTGLKTTMAIDTLGEAQQAIGYQQLESRIKALPDTAAGQQLSEILNAQLMSIQDADDWNLHLARLVGRKFEVGSVAQDMSNLELPDGAQLQSFEFSFLLDTVRFEGRLYCRLMIYIDTDPLRLAKTTNRSISRMAQIFRMTEAELTMLSEPISDYRMTVEYVFDVETLLPASEKSEREIVLRQSVEMGHAIFSRVLENVEKTYTYGKP
jgi:hypothetical protein